MHWLTDLAIRWPRLTIFIAVALSALGTWGALRADASSGAHALIGRDHPEVLRLERFLESFGGGYPAIVAWTCDGGASGCHDVLDARSLAMAHQVATKLSQSRFVRRVLSPSDAPLIFRTEDGIAIRSLYVAGEEPPQYLVRAARADPMWRRTLLSADGKTAALVVEAITTNPRDQVELVSEIERTLEPFAAHGFTYRLSGNPVFHVSSQREGVAEAAVVGAATAAVMAIGFFLFLRSWQSVLALMSVVGLATGIALGIIPLLGWPWDPLVSGAPTLVLVMGSADAVHFITAYWRARAAGTDEVRALTAAGRETFVPCLMTTATSTAGVLSFLATDSVGFGRFGAVTGAGVGASLIMTFTVLPAVLRILPDGRQAGTVESVRWDGIVGRLIRFPVANATSVLLASLALAVAGGVGLTRLTADANPLSYWRAGHPTREAFEFVGAQLASIEGVELKVELPAAIGEQPTITHVEALATRLQAIPGVVSIRSVLTPLGSVAEAMEVESVNDQNASELLVLMSLSDASALDGWLSLDQRRLRISIGAEAASVESRERLLDAVQVAVEGVPRDWRVEVTGPSVVQRAIDRVVRDSAFQAVSGTSIIVTVLVMLFLGSLSWGALAMIPNLLPILVLFGLMGIFGIALDAGTALVAPIAVGIAVDDTIHFLHEFSVRRRRGDSPLVASQRAGMHVGRAIVTTSGTLAAGFLAMQVSRFQSIGNIGLLSAACIVTAFAAELLVLPALISATSREDPGVDASLMARGPE